MAVPTDVRDILDVFVIANLPELATFSPFLNVPPGILELIDTETLDKQQQITLPSDFRDILINYVLVQQLRTF